MSTIIGLVINTSSANGKGTVTGQHVKEALDRRELPYIDLSGNNPDDTARKIDKHPEVSSYILCGGDGLLSTFLNSTIGRTKPFGIIPSGTGNDFASALGISDSPSIALQRILSCQEPTLVDLGVAKYPDGTRYFGGAVSFGFDADVNAQANDMTFPKGSSKYKVAVFTTLATFSARYFSLTIDNHKYAYKGMLTTIMNIGNIGGGLQLIPHAVTDDGLLDILILRDISKPRFLRVLPKLLTGTHLNEPEVTVTQGKVVHVDSPGSIAYADGERIGEGPFSITLKYRALNVLK